MLAAAIILAIIGGFICTQNTKTRLGPALLILALVLGVKAV